MASLPAIGAYRNRGPWRRESANPSSGYAQVPVAGSDAGLVLDGRHLNRPFVVSGRLSDGDIVSLITFVRSGPEFVGANPREAATPQSSVSHVLKADGPFET
jgi:hypothetical protein